MRMRLRATARREAQSTCRIFLLMMPEFPLCHVVALGGYVGTLEVTFDITTTFSSKADAPIRTHAKPSDRERRL
jgi:hypothetical protein